MNFGRYQEGGYEDGHIKLINVEVFKDEGISGTVLNREGLNDLLALFNGINKVVVLNTSRL